MLKFLFLNFMFSTSLAVKKTLNMYLSNFQHKNVENICVLYRVYIRGYISDCTCHGGVVF